jgi:hypothetical protein
MSKTSRPFSPKKNSKKLFLEGLRFLFFFSYLGVLGGAVYFSRSFFTVRQEAEVLRQKEILVRSLLPPCDNDPVKDSFWLEGREIFPAKKISKSFSPSLSGGSLSSEFERPAGFAFETAAGDKKTVKIFMGISPEGKITRVVPAGHFMNEKERIFLRGLEGMDSGWLSTEIQAGIPEENLRKIVEAAKAGLNFFLSRREIIFQKAGIVIPVPESEPSFFQLLSSENGLASADNSNQEETHEKQ